MLTRAFVNVGKIIAAYERRLLPGASPFDRYVEALEGGDAGRAARTLGPAAVGGLRLFISNDTQCLKCHNGPLFTNGGFHNIGTGAVEGPHPDFGRMIGIQALMATDLTCLGAYSDDPKRECPDLRFLNRHEDSSFAGAYRVPSLRNVAHTAPYMHDGRFSSLDAVIRKPRPKPSLGGRPHRVSPHGGPDAGSHSSADGLPSGPRRAGSGAAGVVEAAGVCANPLNRAASAGRSWTSSFPSAAPRTSTTARPSASRRWASLNSSAPASSKGQARQPFAGRPGVHHL